MGLWIGCLRACAFQVRRAVYSLCTGLGIGLCMACAQAYHRPVDRLRTGLWRASGVPGAPRQACA
eukprot:4338857-Pyramimonas_sp.AAC.1